MRLAIAVNELICNAIEHGLIQTTAPELWVTVRTTGKELQLVVKDNGPGIAGEQSERKQIKGQGLILKLLHKLNGTIHYSNDPGCTATITVSI